MRRYRKQAGSSLGRRAQRGAVAMGMMAQSGRRSAFRGQTGGGFQDQAMVCWSDCQGTITTPVHTIATSCPPMYPNSSKPDCINAGCTDPNADNYNPSANFDNNSCVYGGSLTTFTTGKTKQKGMRSATGRHSAFRRQTGDDDAEIGCDLPIPIVGCTNPEAINFVPQATQDDGSCLMLQDVCELCANVSLVSSTEGIKPSSDPTTTGSPIGRRPFRQQAGDIPTCGVIGQPVPVPSVGQNAMILNPELSGCGRCQCQIPDGADCPDVYGQWLGGSPFNVDESTCNCDFQSPNCVNPTGGGLLDPTLSNTTFNKLPRLRGKMRNQTGKMSRATQTGSGHTMRCGTPLGGSSNHGWEYPEPTWGFTGCDYLFGTQSECQAQCTSGPSPMGDKMKNLSGRDMCGFYASSSDAPFTG